MSNPPPGSPLPVAKDSPPPTITPAHKTVTPAPVSSVSASPDPANPSYAHLTALLAQALQDVSKANSERDIATSRAQKAEQQLSIQESKANVMGNSASDDKLKIALETFNTFDRYLNLLEVRMQDARSQVIRTISSLVNEHPHHHHHPSHLQTYSSTSDEVPTFQLPPIRRPSRPNTSSSSSHHHLSIPPPGRAHSSAGLVPSNLPPIPIPGRVHPRRRSDQDDLHSETEQDGSDGEHRRMRKRMRSGPGGNDLTNGGPPPLESSSPLPPPPPPSNPRRGSERRSRASDSPRTSFASQFSFPQSPYAPQSYQSQQGYSDRTFHPLHTRLNPHSAQPRNSTGSESTLLSAITPTSAATSATSASINNPSPSSNNGRRMDSMEGLSMMGGLRVASPGPMDRKPRRRSDEDDETLDVEEVRGPSTFNNRYPDSRSTTKFLTTAINPPEHSHHSHPNTLRPIQEDVLMSPRSAQLTPNTGNSMVDRVRRESAEDLERERMKERDRQLENERLGRSSSGNSQTSPSLQSQPPLVKLKTTDRFRHYSIPLTPHSHQHQQPAIVEHREHSPPHQHHYPPMTATFSINQSTGQLQPTGRRGTIAGLISSTSPNPLSKDVQRASFSGFRRESNDWSPNASGVVRNTGPGPAVKPTLNAQGQRTCRLCGQPGRYKEGKCVEKWGPGPAGPGTVCDRCRKKMKRLERRTTQESSTLSQGTHIPLPQLQREYQFQVPSTSSSFNAGSAQAPTTPTLSPSANPISAGASGGNGSKIKKRTAPRYTESPSPKPEDDGEGEVDEEDGIGEELDIIVVEDHHHPHPPPSTATPTTEEKGPGWVKLEENGVLVSSA